MTPLARAADRLERGDIGRAFFSTPGALAEAIDPRTVHTPALDLLDRNLVDVAEGRCHRLIWSMPPQEGKSVRVSQRFPLWLLTRNPETRIAIVSYELGTARRWGRAIRNDITTHGPMLGLTVRHDTSAAHEWQLAGHQGGIYSVGIGGALTGRPVDCFTGPTKIVTDRGYVAVRDLHTDPDPPRVLAWNHHRSCLEWRAIQATRRVPGREVVEVTTATGRVFTCTPDHRIYTADGYRPAALLRRGDPLLIGRLQPAPRLRDVRQGAESEGRRLPGVLHGGSSVDRGHPDLRALRPVVHKDAGGGREGQAERPYPDLLQPGVRAGVEQGGWRKPLQAVRSRDAWSREGREVLFPGVPESGARGQVPYLPAVRGGVQLLQRPAAVLLPGLRQRSAFGADAGRRELALQIGDELRRVVPGDAPADPRTGRPGLPGLQSARSGRGDDTQRRSRCTVVAGDPPYRSPAPEQRGGQPDHPLHDLPCGTPQVDDDTVLMVRELRGERHDVYDLQVEGCRNFFAEDVLAHNCLIIDDPIKGREEAESATYRQRCWDFWTDTALTRLAPQAPVVLIMTRWHQEDLAGRLIAEDSAGEWRVINVPAQAEAPNPMARPPIPPDPLGRQPGEYLTSARRRTPRQWEAKRVAVGSRTWNALYQGRPAPSEGGLFKRADWQHLPAGMVVRAEDGSYQVEADQVVQSWDMAFKNTSGSDYVVGQVWARRGARVFLLDQVRDRMDFPTSCRAVVALSAKWPQAHAKLIEDKANGPAVIAQLQASVPGLIPHDPEGSKYARAVAVSPFVEAHNVFIPDPFEAPWVADFIEEAAGFPNTAHDDQVDAMTQALTRLLVLTGPVFPLFDDDTPDTPAATSLDGRVAFAPSATSHLFDDDVPDRGRVVTAPWASETG